MVSDMLDRNVSDDLQMESTSVRPRIKLPTTRIELNLHYEDLAGNQCDPLCWYFEIVDQRKNPSVFDAEITLVIAAVDDGRAFKNVGGMEIRSWHCVTAAAAAAAAALLCEPTDLRTLLRAR